VGGRSRTQPRRVVDLADVAVTAQALETL